MSIRLRSAMCLLVGVLAAGWTFAVGTSYWTQTSDSDFRAGTLEGVVATNLGDLKLSRALKTLVEQQPKISSVNVLAEAPDGSIYAGTGPNGVLLRIQGEQVSTAATVSDAAAILSIVVEPSGALILGTAGEAGQVLRIEKPGDKPRLLFQAEGVQYIWGLARTPDGDVYAATGPHGQLFEIKPDGAKRMVLDSGEGNLLSLVSDGKDLLYVGTDPHGLVYRVNRKTAESFVLYNCAESEVSALALDAAGNLYAGTSEAREDATPATDQSAASDKGGRPEGGAAGVPIPSDRPKEPTPPPPPNPNPGQPDPIPKTDSLLTPARPSQTLLHAARLMQRRQKTYLAMLPARGQDRAAMLALEAGSVPLQAVIALDASANNASMSDKPLADPGKPKKRPKPDPGKPNPGPAPGPTPSPHPEPAATPPAAPQQHQPTVDATVGAESRPEGNAIYRIDPAGFVTEMFRQPVLILSMLEKNGTLLVATGGEQGMIYQLRPSADETVVLAQVDAKQIMTLLVSHDGRIYLGTANVGTVASMSSGFAAHGTYSSAVLDATQISRFGKIHLHGRLPAHTSLSVSTRSGNVKEPDEKTWSKWTEEVPATEFVSVTSPSARFLQYRLTFTSEDGKSSPVARDVSIAYQAPNLPPVVKAIKVVSAADAQTDADAVPKRADSARHQTITWDASDPNNDALTYCLYIRQVGEEQWILLKDKLSDATFDWDTRTVADGNYEVKVTASDATSNPPGMGKAASRMSDPITVDNTPPVIGDLKAEQHGAVVKISLKAFDRTSTVASVDYCVDSGKDWQFVLPVDQIYDSPEELVNFSLANLTPGEHQITLRATDSKGNQSFENLFVHVAAPAAMAR